MFFIVPGFIIIINNDVFNYLIHLNIILTPFQVGLNPDLIMLMNLITD